MVVLTEPGGHVHHAGAFGGVDEVTLEDDESTVLAVMRLLWIDFCHIGEETEQRHIAAAHELGSTDSADVGGFAELALVGRDRGFAQHVAASVGIAHHRVLEVRAHC